MPRNRTAKKNKVGPTVHVDDMENYQLRMTDDDRAAWTACAKRAGMALAHWIRLQCVWAAGGEADIVHVEFKSTYSPAPPAKTEFADVRGEVDAFFEQAKNSPRARLMAAEIARRLSTGIESS